MLIILKRTGIPNFLAPKLGELCMANRWLILTIAIILVASALYFHPDFLNSFKLPDFFGGTYSSSSPPDLSFKVMVPEAVVAGGGVEMVLTVSNDGKSAAENVEVIVESSVFQVETPTFTVNPGEIKQVTGRLLASDVREGLYRADFRLRYSSGDMEYFSPEVEKHVYVLPAIRICDVGWKTDLFNPFGRSTISRGDSTTFHFKVENLSEATIYKGIIAKVFMKLKPEGLSVSPSEIEIEGLGPKGISEEYVITVSADANVPPGQYPIRIQLYTADGMLITGTEASVKLTVSS